jgi:pimeloyl-ACP methyl ester carboxylesterase
MKGMCVGGPFRARFTVPVAGGELAVARTDVSPADADLVVLAIHGIGSSHMVWCPTVRQLAERVNACVLAPDLRGRGDSAGLPGPYGFAAHVADLLAVLDHAGVRQAAVVGHSLGAYLATAIAAAHPERVSAVVLVDGGLAVPSSFAADGDELVEAMVDGALEYARGTYGSADEYVAAWRTHPALADEWSDDIDAYVRYDLTGEPPSLRRAVSEEAVRADVVDLVHDEVARGAVDRVRAPVSLLTAPRGLHNDYPILPGLLVDSFVATHPRAYVERIPGVNHYTVLLGCGPGPARVAEAIVGAFEPRAPSPRS